MASEITPVTALAEPFLGLSEGGSGRHLYEYTPLYGSQDLRTLFLDPGEFDDDISCTVCATSMDNIGTYEALSYAWDDPTLTHGILCEDKVIPVAANLYSALRRLRLSNKIRRLWIDAICINQADVEERNRQVQLMGAVYKRASCVLVWLGEEGANSREILQLIAEFDGLPDPDMFTPGALDPEPWSGPARGLVGVGTRDILKPALRSFFERSWFCRAWVIQEVAMASQIKVLCGSASCSWISLLRLVSYLRDNSMSKGRNNAMQSIFIMSILKYAQERGADLPITTLLSLTRSFNCKVPHDKVYSLLGLGLETGQAGIIVDYRIPIKELFTSIAIHGILQQGMASTVLSCAGYHPDNLRKDLPSWTPDWTFIPETHPFGEVCRWGPYKAAAETATDIFLSPTKRVLTVSGLIFDPIKSLSASPRVDPTTADGRDADNVWPDVKPQLEGLKEYYELCQSCQPYPTGENWMVAYSRCLVFDSLGNHGRSDEAIVQGYFAMTEAGEILASTSSDLSDERIARLLALNDMAQEYEAGMKSIHGRRLCITGKQYFGWVPDASNEGDIICILKGNGEPYVLRPLPDGHFLLIGDCYIHGVMNGEVIEMGLPEQKFNIR